MIKSIWFLNADKTFLESYTDNGLPQGSGAIESSIRRVVNLRMKGNSIFWNEESANDMLLIRSFYKAGRWRDIEKMSYEGGLQAAA